MLASATLLGLALTAAAPLPRMAVLELETAQSKGFDPAALTEVFTATLAESREFKVVSSRDVKTLLGFERSRQLLGCTDESCLAQIAGALGVPLVAAATVGTVGERYVLAARIVSTKNAVALARASVTSRSLEELVESMQLLGKKLLEDHRLQGQPSAVAAPAPAEASASTSVSLSPGLYLAFAADPVSLRFGGEAGLGLGVDRFWIGAGVTISPLVGARLMAAVRVAGSDAGLGLSVALRGVVAPSADGLVAGGGAGLLGTWALTDWFDATAVLAGEGYHLTGRWRFSPILTLGVRAHL